MNDKLAGDGLFDILKDQTAQVPHSCGVHAESSLRYLQQLHLGRTLQVHIVQSQLKFLRTRS